MDRLKVDFLIVFRLTNKNKEWNVFRTKMSLQLINCLEEVVV